MKKNVVRIVAALLVAMLALTLIPMGAFAIESAYVEDHVYDKHSPTLSDGFWLLGSAEYAEGTTIKTKDYDKLYKDDAGNLYDFKGFATLEKFHEKAEKLYTDPKIDTPEKLQAAIDQLAKETKLDFVNKDLKIDKFPVNGDYDDFIKWANKYSFVIAGYTPHQHKLSYWYSDGTTHWRECLVCDENFMYQNWCTDGDEDGICNVCGGDVPYHDITVIEEEGGKITVNRDNACHRMKITADVEPAEGYKLKKLHFTKIRDNGSEQEITRYKKDGQFWTYMPTYELEVSAEFVKVK